MRFQQRKNKSVTNFFFEFLSICGFPEKPKRKKSCCISRSSSRGEGDERRGGGRIKKSSWWVGLLHRVRGNALFFPKEEEKGW